MDDAHQEVIKTPHILAMPSQQASNSPIIPLSEYVYACLYNTNE